MSKSSYFDVDSRRLQEDVSLVDRSAPNTYVVVASHSGVAHAGELGRDSALWRRRVLVDPDDHTKGPTEVVHEMMVQSDTLGERDLWGFERWRLFGNSPSGDEEGPSPVHRVVAENELGGGDHDRVWLVYYALEPKYGIEVHRSALGRRGQWLPVHLYSAKRDAERIIVGLHQQKIPHTDTAHLFNINEKTVRRILERNSNVQHYPSPKERDVTPSQMEEALERHFEKQTQKLINVIVANSGYDPAAEAAAYTREVPDDLAFTPAED